MSTAVLVSVLMTAYNRKNYISEAIESVLASTYKYFELIIVDDASDDDTPSIAHFYAAKDSRIKVFVNSHNLGDYRNRNLAASHAKGVYLKYVDSDDCIMPWCLEIMVYCMERFPEASIGVSSNQFENIFYPLLYSPISAYRAYYYHNQLLSVGPTATIIRRSIFLEFGGFSGENYVGDTQLWLQLSKSSPVVYLPPGLIYWREHEGQQIVEERKNSLIELRRFKLDCSVLSDKDIPLSKKESSDIIQNLRNIKTRNAIKSFFIGDFKKSINIFLHFKISLSDVLKSFKKNKII
jgi:glycosyltransferase involved in cell wall biosynthesis